MERIWAILDKFNVYGPERQKIENEIILLIKEEAGRVKGYKNRLANCRKRVDLLTSNKKTKWKQFAKSELTKKEANELINMAKEEVAEWKTFIRYINKKI